MRLRGEVRESFRRQAVACRNLGSPFTARLCTLLAGGLPPGTATAGRLAGWPGDPVADALPLRLAGALHFLARSGRAPALAAVYPPQDVADPALAAAVTEAVAANDAEIAAFLDSPPQTNEVARSAVLIGGLQCIAAETGAALELLEIGASAGLNLLPDRWGYELGGDRRWGASNAPVIIACEWRGWPPPLPRLDIAGRRGCDIRPVDAADPAARARLLAYVWADQGGRLRRTEAALGYAARHGPAIDTADADAWLAARLATRAESGNCRVLMHSVMWHYLPARTRRAVTAAMVAAGAVASARRPLAWLRMEADGTAETAAVTLTTWPGGRTRALGRADFHGRFVVWSGAR